MITIRPAEEKDLPSILDITNDAILNSNALWEEQPVTITNREQWFATKHEAGVPVLVCVDRHNINHVLGFGSYGPFRPHEGFKFSVEHSLYVSKEARGQGAGKLLLQHLISHAKNANMHVMVGGISADNAVSIALHEKFGFTQQALLPQVGRKFGKWLDLLFMTKQL